MKSFTQAINEWTISSKTVEKYKQDGYENSINVQLIDKIHNKHLFDEELRKIYQYNIMLYVREWLNTVKESHDHMINLIENIERISQAQGKYIHATKEACCPIRLLNSMGITNDEEFKGWNADYKERFEDIKKLLENIIEVDSFLYENLHDYEKLECDERSEIFWADVSNVRIHNPKSITCNHDKIFFKLDFISEDLYNEYKDEINEMSKKSTEHFNIVINHFNTGTTTVKFIIKGTQYENIN